MLAVASSAGAAAPATLHVRGTQTVVNEAAGTYRMHGSLVGAWATTAFTPTFESDTLFVGKGTERFNGCVDANRNGACGAAERHGVLRFSFVYWANYDAKTGCIPARTVRPSGDRVERRVCRRDRVCCCSMTPSTVTR